MPRSGGFNSIDYGAVRPETLAVTDVLMFIGGGSASTAGGIKVTTFLLLAFVIWAEVRGEHDVDDRPPPDRRARPQRQALTVALLGVGAGRRRHAGPAAASPTSPFDRVLFEATSAFATVGLSHRHHPGPAGSRRSSCSSC